ncbi:MAG: transposase [Fastidiosipila sp.]|nr:transposase [Fastidiosipila sp.]
MSWDAYSEGTDLPKAIEGYKERYGYYPERVLGDKTFRTRKNRRYSQEHGIRLNGPPLGRPPKDRTIYDERKRLER